MGMDRHWIKCECGSCGNLADIRVEENDGWTFNTGGQKPVSYKFQRGLVWWGTARRWNVNAENG